MIGRLIRGAVGITAALALTASLSTSAAAQPRVVTSLTAVESNYMCTECHEPLAVAQSGEAIEERELIQHLVVQGDTPAQIQRVMVAQYGLAVLAKPPARGFNLLIYILPPVAVVLGLALLAYTLPKWRDRARRSESAPYASSTPLSDDDAARLDADLARFD